MKCFAISAVLLVTLLSPCHGFFWNTQSSAPSEPQQKSMPFNLFRTFTYTPLALQTPSMPASFRFIPSSNNVLAPQILAKSIPVGTLTPNTILAPTNVVSSASSNAASPVTTSAPATPPPAPIIPSQPAPDMIGFHSMLAPTQQNNPTPLHQGQTTQQLPPGHPQYNPQQRQYQYYPENPFQYLPPQPQYNVQQVQFVPCMCPVAVGLSSDPLPPPYYLEKRANSDPAKNIEALPQEIIEVPETTSANN